MGEAPIPPGGPEHLERFVKQRDDTSSGDPPFTEAQMEMVASWSPRDAVHLHELCSAGLKFQVVYDLYGSFLSRGALSMSPDSVLDVALGQRSRAEFIAVILQCKVFYFSDISVGSRLTLQHALIDIFEPSFASMAVEFINRENICDHDLDWRIALAADNRAEFLGNHFPILLPEKVQGEFTHYTKKDKHEVVREVLLLYPLLMRHFRERTIGRFRPTCTTNHGKDMMSMRFLPVFSVTCRHSRIAIGSFSMPQRTLALGEF